jgi:membrane fusion protein, multidrug efflux system
MKLWVERSIMYLGAIALIAALVVVANIYGKMARKSQEKTRRESVATSNNKKSKTKVKICKVFYQPLTDILKLPGTVEAYHDIDVAARMGGTVERIGFEEGDKIEKGDKLLQLDVAAIKSQVAKAETAMELAEQKFKRTKDLFEKKVASRDAFDDADASLKTSKSALEESLVSLEYGTLYSPVSGFLDRRDIDPGEHIESGKTIMKIVDIDKVRIIFNIPEKDILYFKKGQEVKIIASNGKERGFPGTVEFVALTAEPVSRTYPLKVVVENSDHHLRPGMIVRSSLVRRKIEKGIAVPFFTLTEREEGKGVFIVHDGKAKEVLIEYGMFQGGLVEIVKGLKIGDNLIVVGQRNLVNGEEVEIADDLTVAAKAFIASGKDLSSLALVMNGILKD